MRYEIYAQTKNTYYIKHYKNIYDYAGRKRGIRKSDFFGWQVGKIDATDYSKIEDRANQVVEEKITLQEKKVINPIIKEIEKYGYIIERDVEVADLSIAKTKRILDNSNLLQRFGIERVRATKRIKEQLGITIKGYPFIIVKNTK